MTPIMSACRGQNLGVLKFFLDMKPTLSSVEIQVCFRGEGNCYSEDLIFFCLFMS